MSTPTPIFIWLTPLNAYIHFIVKTFCFPLFFLWPPHLTINDDYDTLVILLFVCSLKSLCVARTTTNITQQTLIEKFASTLPLKSQVF